MLSRISEIIYFAPQGVEKTKNSFFYSLFTFIQVANDYLLVCLRIIFPTIFAIPLRVLNLGKTALVK